METRDGTPAATAGGGQPDVSMAALRDLLDRQAIRDCIGRYARGADRHDEDLIRSAFWPDAQINYGSFSGPPEAFARWANAWHDERYSAHLHHIGAQTADIEGDAAHVETYVLYVLGEKAAPKVRVGAGRYVERYERRNGEWRIAVREFIADLTFRAEAEELTPYFQANRLSARDRSDLSYARPLERRQAPGRPLRAPAGP